VTTSGTVTFNAFTITNALTVSGATTLTGAVTATNASNDITGVAVTTANIAAIADQVWDEVLAGHLGAGSTGFALNAAGSAGDPWGTALPGAYGAGTAGNILGNNLTVSTATIAAYIDTEVAAIKAKTDNLPSDPADASDIASAFGTVNATLATIAGYIDTEVGAIKAKTDLINTATFWLGAFATNSGSTYAGAVAGSVVKEIADNAGGAALTTDDIAEAMFTYDATATYATANAGSVVKQIANNAVGSGGAVGPGSISFTITINDDVSAPIDGAEVWVSTDSAGSNVIAGTLSTDAMGQVTFLLDAGSYFLWVSHSGYNRTNPTAFTVS
jgi:hypothetical protein